MKDGSLRVLPTAVTPENAPLSDRNGNFQEFLRTFEITSLIYTFGGVIARRFMLQSQDRAGFE